VEQSAVVDEETTGIRNAGAGWLVEHGHVSPAGCDVVVITEPLNVENVCLGHRGRVIFLLFAPGISLDVVP
jgi:succinyl-diaminopimelate desuccinylase